jgi:hypothetical protein
MVRVETDDDSEHTGITKVVVCIDPEDIHLARDHRGQFLVYDEAMEPVHGDTDPATNHAIHVAEDRAGWPAVDSLGWEEGPTRCASPTSTTTPSLSRTTKRTTSNRWTSATRPPGRPEPPPRSRLKPANRQPRPTRRG